MRIKVEWTNKDRFIANLDTFQKKFLNATLKGVEDALEKVQKQANNILTETRSPLVVPQSERRENAQNPIETSWELLASWQGDDLIGTLRNTSQHAAAVEFGTQEGRPIQPRGPWMVWDTYYYGFKDVVYWPKSFGPVHGQPGKGFLSKAAEISKKEIEATLSKYLGSV